MKFNFKAAGLTVAEIGVIGASMIATKKFLDAKTIFKDQIAKDPTYADKFQVKHQGAIKLAVGAAGAVFIKNPWAKMAFIGVGLEGFISEVRTVTTKKDGSTMFDAIGNQVISSDASLDKELLESARMLHSTSGNGENYQVAVGMRESDGGSNYHTAVGDYDINHVSAVGEVIQGPYDASGVGSMEGSDDTMGENALEMF